MLSAAVRENDRTCLSSLTALAQETFRLEYARDYTHHIPLGPRSILRAGHDIVKADNGILHMVYLMRDGIHELPQVGRRTYEHDTHGDLLIRDSHPGVVMSQHIYGLYDVILRHAERLHDRAHLAYVMPVIIEAQEYTPCSVQINVTFAHSCGLIGTSPRR